MTITITDTGFPVPPLEISDHRLCYFVTTSDLNADQCADFDKLMDYVFRLPPKDDDDDPPPNAAVTIPEPDDNPPPTPTTASGIPYPDGDCTTFEDWFVSKTGHAVYHRICKDHHKVSIFWPMGCYEDRDDIHQKALLWLAHRILGY